MLQTILSLRNECPHFAVHRLQEQANQIHVSMHTVCRYLHKNGNGYYQSRKRGLITTNDKSIRLAFANFWTKQMAFYFNGVSFAFKNKPSRTGKSAQRYAMANTK